MHFARVQAGLETQHDFSDLLPQFDNDSLEANCSNITEDVARDLENDIFSNLQASSDLESQRQYLKDIANWLADNVAL